MKIDAILEIRANNQIVTIDVDYADEDECVYSITDIKNDPEYYKADDVNTYPDSDYDYDGDEFNEAVDAAVCSYIEDTNDGYGDYQHESRRDS